MGVRRASLLGCAVGIAIGIAAAPAAKILYVLARGSKSVACFSGVCAGMVEDRALAKLSVLPNTRGGLTRVVCGDGVSARQMVLDELLRGRCSATSFWLDYTDTYVETQIHFENGRVTTICRVPARFIDL
jgi:hypothetical protein